MLPVVAVAAVAAIGARAAAFLATSRAVGLPLPALSAALIFLVGAQAAAAIPAPGGVGPVEIALTGALTAAGAPFSSALACVLCYRLLSFWAPPLFGLAALWTLHHRGALRRDGAPAATGGATGHRAGSRPARGASARPPRTTRASTPAASSTPR